MLVSRISPAPRSAPFARPGHGVAGPVGVRPPRTNTSQRPRRGRRDARVDGEHDGLGAEAAAEALAGASGRCTAAVLTATLSAPARSSASASSTDRTPPPTVNGQEHRVRHPPRHVEHDRPRVGGGGDVEEARARPRLPRRSGPRTRRDRRRRAGRRTSPLDHAATVHVEAGHEALGEGHGQPPPPGQASWASASVKRFS